MCLFGDLGLPGVFLFVLVWFFLVGWFDGCFFLLLIVFRLGAILSQFKG